MNHTIIERLRLQIRAAITARDMDRAWLLSRVVVGIRIIAGEIPVKLKPPELLRNIP